MSFRKAVLATAAAAAAALTVGAGTAMAAPRPHPAPHINHAIAAVELLGAGSEQFATVNANSPGRLFRGEGFVCYTNFSFPGRSRVWSLNTRASETLTVHALGNVYQHTLNRGEILAAVSNNEVKFTGTGFYNPVPSDNWSVAGDIHGRAVTLNITYGPWAVPQYSAVDTGLINVADGSASGTFVDSAHVTGTWSLPAGTFRTVTNYCAPIQRDAFNVNFRRHTADADVVFRVPFGNPFAGTRVEWNFGTVFGHKFFFQGINHGRLFPEVVESGLIAIS